MDLELLRKVQLAQLEIAREFKRICEKNGIKYFMDSGTLLGAVRHKGFIPWDDDMDFGLLRDEYEKFIAIAPNELSDQYFLQTWKTDNGFPYGFAKIRKRNTVYVEAAYQKTSGHKELWIDIFPYDVYPNSQNDRKKQGKKIMQYRYELMMKAGILPWARHKSIIEKILVFGKYVPYMLLASIHSHDEIVEKAERVMKQFDNIETGSIFPQGGGAIYGRWVIPSDCGRELVDLPFEDDTFLAPAKYHEYLSLTYGNYMQLPPVEKRGNWHQILEVKL